MTCSMIFNNKNMLKNPILKSSNKFQTSVAKCDTNESWGCRKMRFYEVSPARKYPTINAILNESKKGQENSCIFVVYCGPKPSREKNNQMLVKERFWTPKSALPRFTAPLPVLKLIWPSNDEFNWGMLPLPLRWATPMSGTPGAPRLTPLPDLETWL